MLKAMVRQCIIDRELRLYGDVRVVVVRTADGMRKGERWKMEDESLQMEDGRRKYGERCKIDCAR